MEDQVLRVKVVVAALAFVSLLGLVSTVRAVFAAVTKRVLSRAERWAYGLSWAGCALWIGCFAYGVLWEADWVEVTHEVLETRHLAASARYRIVHLSDLHVDRMTDALARLPAIVDAERPDLVVFTGDSLNDAAGLPVLRETFAAMHPRDGILAVRGNHDVWYWNDLPLFDGVATELGREARRIGPLAACGAPYGVTGRVSACLRGIQGDFKLFAYHTPDLVEELAGSGIDLYLAGHTHGGQVRIPFFGALVTFSAFDKKYEGGRYTIGGTTLYVNRGLGFEPGLPRVRFLCRPEVTVIDLVGTGG